MSFNDTCLKRSLFHLDPPDDEGITAYWDIPDDLRDAILTWAEDAFRDDTEGALPHSRLCLGQWSRWHFSEQYRAMPQPLHTM